MNTKDERFKNINVIQKEIKKREQLKILDELFPKSKYSIEGIKAGKYSKLDSITFADSSNSKITEFKINNCNLNSLDLSNVPIQRATNIKINFHNKQKCCIFTSGLRE